MFTLSAFADEISPDPREQVRVLKACQVRFIEFRSIYKTNVLNLNEQQLREFKSLIESEGIGLSAIGSPIGKYPIDQPFEPHLDRFKKAIDLCGFFGTKNIRVFSYYPPDGSFDGNWAPFEEEVFRRMRVKAELAQQAGVQLVHENEHRIYGDEPHRVRKLLKTIDNPAMKAAYDAANWVFCGYDPRLGWDLTKDDTVHFHIKDWKKPQPDEGHGHGVIPGTGDGDIAYSIRDAVQRGYRGFAVMEPHLRGGGPTGGVTGADLFPYAVEAFRKILAIAAVSKARAMLTVHLRINDAATGQPLPVRVRLSRGETHFVPLGRFQEFPTMRGEFVGGQTLLGTERWFTIDGSCEVPLPSDGPIRVQACHGPQYAILDETISLKPGQMAIRLALSRRLNWQADGWRSIEGRCHELTPHAALAEAAAEDVDVVQLLLRERRVLSQDGNSFRVVSQLETFSGQQPALSCAGRDVYVNTFNSHAVLGQLALLHTHRVIHPLSFGPPDDSDDWSLTDWCHQAHRKNGFVVWCNPFAVGSAIVGGEALVCAILGLVDAIEFDARTRQVPFLPLWYRLLNCGLKLPLLAGSAKDSNTAFLGWPRTFVNICSEPEAPPKSWIQALREGPSFVTNGPMITLRQLPNTDQVELVAESVVPFQTMELVQNGLRIASAESTWEAGVFRAGLRQSIQPSGWLAGRIAAKAFSPLAPSQLLIGHTNPLWVGPVVPPSDEDKAFLKRCVSQTREWLAEHGQFRLEKSQRLHLDQCDAALTRLEWLRNHHFSSDPSMSE